ncbi:hypothetical protein [Saccharibacillus deserti]|uniref:hypothetical protein n=1 Tax=Saccharibacillus deserti TaxID=1634444 RepID=UPI001552C771|nr:hypothetical protein [Saccharibacillus deserti]
MCRKYPSSEGKQEVQQSTGSYYTQQAKRKPARKRPGFSDRKIAHTPKNRLQYSAQQHLVALTQQLHQFAAEKHKRLSQIPVPITAVGRRVDIDFAHESPIVEAHLTCGRASVGAAGNADFQIQSARKQGSRRLLVQFFQHVGDKDIVVGPDSDRVSDFRGFEIVGKFGRTRFVRMTNGNDDIAPDGQIAAKHDILHHVAGSKHKKNMNLKLQCNLK